ncbi:MAG: transcriptional regulator [Clostridia bacterium]|jgi:Lrp/AsnC family leucine-responsive transcriptional regulator|nr:transcriptional regulator [Clostridia bacterium]
MIDQTDRQIINLLKQNARMQWQEIGEYVHLTGQAVKNRIVRLEKLGIIEGYTVRLNTNKLGVEITAFVTVFMKTTAHTAFQEHLKKSALIEESHRISGEGCYLLKLHVPNQQALIVFLDEILQYGNYKVNLSIGQIE